MDFVPTYPVLTADTAPEGSRETLRRVEAQLGMVPNLAATMAKAPSLVKGFFDLREIYHQGTLTALEIEVLSLTNAYENGCRYCMALHSTFASKVGLSEESLTELRHGRPPLEGRLAALSNLSRSLVRGRGHVEPEVLESFCGAGYTAAQALEVVVGVAVSTLANFSHHLTEAPLDAPFLAQEWSPPAKVRELQAKVS